VGIAIEIISTRGVKMINLKQLNFDTGGFVRAANNGCTQIDKNNPDLQLRLAIQAHSPNELILQISIQNRGESQHLNALFVEFELPEFKPHQVLVNGWCQEGFSGYTQGIHRTQKRKVFFRRDQNPYSFLPEYGYVEKAQISEWYAQVVRDNEAVLIGALTTSNQFTTIYVVKKDGGTFVRMACQLDGIILPGGESLKSEKLYLAVGGRDELLDKFACLLQKFAGINNLPKPVKGLCCSYYYQGNKVDEKYVKEQLLALDRLPCTLGLETIQIDAGYSAWGDWLDTSKKFPSGMQTIVAEINKRGLKAGIWIAPFIASPHSKLCKEHKDWFINATNGRPIAARFTFPLDCLPPLAFRVLDVTKPAVQAYITSVVEQFVDWGFEYIKTDFTYPLCFATNYEVPMTRAQALRLGFEVIKKAAKGKALIESCITPLSPMVGVADYVRTGSDTMNPYVCSIPLIRNVVNKSMVKANLRNCEARQFLNGKIWINDADCLVCRPNTGLSSQLIDQHDQFLKEYQGSIWTGDNLNNLEWENFEKYLFELFGYQPKKKSAVSVVVPAWNEEKTIQNTLVSLAIQQTKVPFEVIFVDNNCTDDTVTIVKNNSSRVNNLRLVCEKTQGIGAARNAGFSCAVSELIASTDADTIIPVNWISKIYARFWEDTNLAALVGPFIFYSKGNLYNLAFRVSEMAVAYLHRLFIGSYAFRGNNFAVRKTYWEKAGGFNTQISAGEDLDLSVRVGEIGEIKYLPTLTVSTSFRRFEGRALRQFFITSQAYIYRAILKNSEKHTDWEPIR